MDLQNKIVTVFGGTGFAGRYIIAHLARVGARVKVATRHPSAAYFLRQFGTVGQIVPVFCAYQQDDIDGIVKGSDAVVFCPGILFEKGKSTFQRVHVEYAEQVAAACAKHNVTRLVHISALGVDQAKSKYAKSKLQGEEAVRKAFPKATILRPSVMFGAEDNFFNKFASLSVFSPFLPMIGGGKTKFQPVYVGDVAEAVARALTLSDVGTASPIGKTYELGGPETLDFKGIYDKIASVTERKRAYLTLPTAIARVQAAFFSLLPTPILTNDQITSLETDNVVTGNRPTFADMGITPTAVDAVIPNYLDHYRAGGRFADKQRA